MLNALQTIKICASQKIEVNHRMRNKKYTIFIKKKKNKKNAPVC